MFETDIKAPNNTTNFFGYGEARYMINQARENTGFTGHGMSLGRCFSFAEKKIFRKSNCTIGPTFQFYKLDPNEDLNKTRFIVYDCDHNGLDPATLFAKQSYVGGKFNLNVDLRDNQIITQRGINWVTTYPSFFRD